MHGKNCHTKRFVCCFLMPFLAVVFVGVIVQLFLAPKMNFPFSKSGFLGTYPVCVKEAFPGSFPRVSVKGVFPMDFSLCECKRGFPRNFLYV